MSQARPPGFFPDRARRLVRLLLCQPVEVGAGERRGRRGEGDAAADGAAVVGRGGTGTLQPMPRGGSVYLPVQSS